MQAKGVSSKDGVSSGVTSTYLSSPHEMEAYAHTIAYEIIRVFRHLPEQTRDYAVNGVMIGRQVRGYFKMKQ